VSIDSVEKIHERLKAELDRLQLNMAEAARRMGESDSQGLRDVCSGRKRVSAEMLAKLVPLGVDVMYVLTSTRTLVPASTLSEEEAALVDNYKHSDEEGRAAARRVLSSLAQSRKAA
jgi:hypothetical protein